MGFLRCVNRDGPPITGYFHFIFYHTRQGLVWERHAMVRNNNVAARYHHVFRNMIVAIKCTIMKKLIYILLLGTFFHASQRAFAQTLNALWANAAGGRSSDQGRAIATDKSGNCVVAGSFQGAAFFGNDTLNNIGSDDIFIAKFDAAGKLVWVKQAGGEDFDRGLAVAIDGAGNIVVTGFFEGFAIFDDGVSLSSEGSSSDVFVAKYDATGRLLWVKQAGESGNDAGNAVAVDETNNIIIVGSFEGTITFGNTTFESNGDFDIFVAKYDAQGNVLWAKQAGGSNFDEGLGVVIDAANNIAVTGYFAGNARFDEATLRSSTGEDDDIFIAKYDAAGKLVWAKSAGGDGFDAANAIATDKLNIILTGNFQGVAAFDSIRVVSNDFSEDIFIARYDESGNARWVQSAGGGDFDDGLAIAVDDAGNSFITGYFTDQASFGEITLLSAGRTDIFIAKYGAAGNLLEAVKAGGASASEEGLEDAGFGIATDGAGNVYASGVFYETATFGQLRLRSAGAEDVFIAKYGAVVARAESVPSNATPYPNQSISVAINFDGSELPTPNNRLGAYSANLRWDPKIVQFLRVTPAPAPWDTPNLNLNETASGRLEWNDFVSGGVPGKFNLLNVNFKIVGAAGASAIFDLSFAEITTSTTFNLLPVLNITDGRATILNNQPPLVSNTIPDQTLTLGGVAFRRSLNSPPVVFADPDQDILTYTASSSDTNIAIADISGSMLTVAARRTGRATITVTADDNKGGSVSTAFTVTVVMANRPPVVANAIPNQALTVGGASFIRNLESLPVVFGDPDQDALTYSASSSAANIATASLSGSTLTVSPVGGGSATITVIADDKRGGTAQTQFTVTINRPPVVANAIPNQTLAIGGSPFIRNLDGVPVVFGDLDQDALTYTASSSAVNIATASISGSTLTVAAVAVGSARITVTANDNKGGTAPTAFTLTVNPRPAIPNAPSNLIAEAVSTRQINLQWQDNSTNEDGFRIERRIGAVDTVIVVGANVTRYQDMSLRPGAPASYQIRAFSAGGNSAATNAALTTTATGLRGDVIPDFRLNAQDVSRVVDIIFQRAANLTRLDSTVADCESVFPDGKINVVDVVYIVNASLGSSLATLDEPAAGSNAVPTSGELIVGPIIGRTANLAVTIAAAEPVAVVQFKFRYDRRKITLGEPAPAAQNSSLKIAAARAPEQLAVLVYNLSAQLLPAGQHELLHISLAVIAGDFSAADLQIESVLVVGEQGRVIPVLVRHQAAEPQAALPAHFSLEQNYPNPFALHMASGNALTEIAYILPAAAPVRLSIYNLMGQEIAVLIDEVQTARRQKATWNGRNRAGEPVLSGVYFYRLHAGSFVATKKMLIMP
jgi:uncharacterized protein YjdB